MLRVDEIYLSVQGEGPRVGWPTVFVRFGGCNLRCPGWPCDTQHAIDPAFRNNWEKLEAGAVASRTWDLLPDMGDGLTHITNICLTGGEPFLQPSESLKDFVQAMKAQKDIGDVECFSNGTILYPQWAFEKIKFVMDWKLEGSGEDPHHRNRLINLSEMGEDQSVKFTIADRQDYLLARTLWSQYIDNRSLVQVFYGAVWGQMDNAELISWVLADGLPWRFQMQIHNYVWDREQRGI